MEIKLTALGGNWERVYPSESTPVCVSVGANMHQPKTASELQIGDVVCAHGPVPADAGGVEIETKEEV